MPEQGLPFSEQVAQHLQSRLGEAPIGVEDIAGLFNMTGRTLQRRLQREQASFGELRDNLRRRLAQDLLADPAVDMSEVARRLGFSDTANFYHAFRRWEARTPGACRRDLAAARQADT